MKRFAGFGRVSSREQLREGYSLGVQERAIREFVAERGATLEKLELVAESAKDTKARKKFHETLNYALKHKLDGIVFHRTDRAGRSQQDAGLIEKLADAGVHSYFIVERLNTETAQHEVMLHLFAALNRYQSRSMRITIKEAIAERVERDGLFPGRASWGYKNLRDERGRAQVLVHPTRGPNLSRIYEEFANNVIAVPELRERLFTLGIYFSDRCQRFTRSKLYQILNDRSYLGEVRFLGQWWPGKFPPLVSRELFERVQTRLGRKGRRRTSRVLLFSGELLRCGHCDHAVTGEFIKGRYSYYRCSQYNAPDHPRVRVKEEALDAQVRSMLESLRVNDPEIRDWFVRVLRTRSRRTQVEAEQRREQLASELAKTQRMMNELVDLRLRNEIESDTFVPKHASLRGRVQELRAAMDDEATRHADDGEQAVGVFELAQDLTARWVAAETATKRLLLDIVCLNLVLDGENLVPTLRRPFDLLAAGVLLPQEENGRGERI